MIVFLIGFMGSGKSTVAKKLSRLKGWDYIDLDSLIEQEEGLTISEIFDRRGEAAFRVVESETLRSIDSSKDIIVSCGGGTPCFNDNISWMNQKGYTIYLQLSVAALKNRLINSKISRPLISNIKESELDAFIEDSLSDREEYYLQAKECIDGLSLDIKKLSDRLESLYPYNP